ncbi:DUF167 domain-containing protein [Terriglobus roseus]|uniref:UPF0235 protein SAMN05443244_1363 n=1 Tax=Terriglobus roseus TaxID=392734 RepID=A0A1H4KUM1_9BACT|nr:DUF167 domain-containing protein [Terriglobus roseus]SEB62224.1 hypothetical protein SAMN05443244_1363 [Terriglobus roseus]
MAFAVSSMDGGVSFAVRVQPGASRECIVGEYGDALKIALTAPAVDGKANEALIRYVATLLSVPRMSVEIASGTLSRSKIVRVTGISAEEAAAKLMRIESA